MPYQIVQTSKNGYGLWNKDKKEWKSYDTTKQKAEKQMKLLNYIDAQKYKKKKQSKYL